MTRKSLLLLLTSLTLLLFQLSPAQARGGGLARFIATGHGELAADWWQYVTSFPAAGNPLDEQGEVDCTKNQNGPVTFLAGANLGNTVERSCTVPRRPLFFPVINLLFDNAPGEESLSVAEKRALLDGVISDTEPGVTGSRVCEVSALLDGEPISYRASIVRAQSPPFLLVTGPDGFPPDANDPEAVSDGFWVLLPRLPRGEHTLRFSARFCEIDSFADHPLGAVDVTYQLTVE